MTINQFPKQQLSTRPKLHCTIRQRIKLNIAEHQTHIAYRRTVHRINPDGMPVLAATIAVRFGSLLLLLQRGQFRIAQLLLSLVLLLRVHWQFALRRNLAVALWLPICQQLPGWLVLQRDLRKLNFKFLWQPLWRYCSYFMCCRFLQRVKTFWKKYPLLQGYGQLSTNPKVRSSARQPKERKCLTLGSFAWNKISIYLQKKITQNAGILNSSLPKFSL